MEAEEAVQPDISFPEASFVVPQAASKAFKQVRWKPGETRKASFDFLPAKLAYFGNAGPSNQAGGGGKVYSIPGGASSG